MATLNEISERVGVLQNTVSSLLDNPLVSAMKKTRRRVLCTCGWIGYHNMFHLSIEVLDARPSVVPEFLRTLVFARPRGDDQFADCTFSPSLDMSR